MEPRFWAVGSHPPQPIEEPKLTKVSMNAYLLKNGCMGRSNNLLDPLEEFGENIILM
jgi:hypothetical protein